MAERGLGRGLAALLDEAESYARPTGPAGVTVAAIEALAPNRDQPRSNFPEAELDALAASIRQKGVIQPILVRSTPGPRPFQIIAGERRWRAAQKAGETSVPVIVRELNDEQAMEIALIENIQRTDLNPLEEARGYAALARDYARSHESIAQTVGKSRSHVANTMRLLKLPPEVQAHLEAGRLTAGHARALLDLPDAPGAADRIIDGGLNVRQTEALARQLRARSPGGASRLTRAKDIDTRDLELGLANVLGLKVQIHDTGSGGNLRIEYQTLEQLDDLCRRLSRPA